MKKRPLLCLGFLVLCLLLPACVPDELSITTESELGPNTLYRIDRVNEILDKGVIQIAPETRELIEEINNTIDRGVRFGFDEATLKRVDSLLRTIEDGLEIGLTEETRETVEGLIDTIDNAPQNWGAAAEEIILALERSGGTLAGKVSDEVKEVIHEAKNAAKEVSNAIAVDAGILFRCNADFLSQKVETTVDEIIGQGLVGRLRAILTGKDAETAAPEPWVCHRVPVEITLIDDSGQVKYKGETIRIVGYNFTNSNLPAVRVVDSPGEAIELESELHAFLMSPYEVGLSIQGIDFGGVPPRSRIEFRWTGDNITNIPMNLPEPEREAELVVTSPGAKVYKGPGTDYHEIGTASANSRYIVTGRSGDRAWWQIDYDGGGGQSGWIANEHVTRNDVPIDEATNIPLLPVARFQASPKACTAPCTVTFEDQSGTNVTEWVWDFGEGEPVSTRSKILTHEYRTPSTYEVELIVKNDAGFDRRVETVVVNAPGVVARFEAQHSTPCIAECQVTFRNHSTGHPDSLAYRWDFGDGKTSTERNPTHAYQAAGVYTVKLEVNDGYDQASASTRIEVVQAVVANFKAQYTKPCEVQCRVAFSDQSTGGPKRFEWDFGDGQRSTDRNPVHVYKSAGKYTVTLIASNDHSSDPEEKRDYIEVIAPQRTCITVRSRVEIKDDEVGDDEYGSLYVNEALVLGRDSQKDLHFEKCVGGEVRVEMDAKLTVGGNLNAAIAGETRLYEGTSCSTGDREDRYKFSLAAQPNGHNEESFVLRNTETFGGDWAKVKLYLTSHNRDRNGDGRFDEQDCRSQMVARQFRLDFEGYDGLAVGDVNGDGKAEIVHGDRDDYIRVYSMSGGRMSQFKLDFEGQDGLAVGDLDGDGVDEIVHGDRDDYIRVYDMRGNRKSSFKVDFEGADGLAVGDVNGDGRAEIIHGDRDDRIQIFRMNGGQLASFRLDFEGADGLAVGDVNGDGRAEIIHGDRDDLVQVYSMDGRRLNSFNLDFEGDDGLAAGDVDGDGIDEILHGDRNDWVSAFDRNGRVLIVEYLNFEGADRLAAGDLDGDGRADIVHGDRDDQIQIRSVPSGYVYLSR